MRRAILAEGADEEAAALDELRAVQREDFSRLLRVMDGLPVTVRLLDPPLHEFLPDHVELEVAAATGTLDAEGERLLDAARAWQESNPMLGVRGCRLGVLKPELYRVQVRALLEAALAVQRLGGTVRLRDHDPPGLRWRRRPRPWSPMYGPQPTRSARRPARTSPTRSA